MYQVIFIPWYIYDHGIFIILICYVEWITGASINMGATDTWHRCALVHQQLHAEEL